MIEETQNLAKGDFMTPEQVEEEFGINKKQQTHLRMATYYQDKKNKDKIRLLPYYKILGVGIRYKRDEIKKWIESQRVI